MRKHAAANDAVRTVNAIDKAVHKVATSEWERGYAIGEKNGWRNAQASVLAPTGTIGFMMDCDTTGIEPDFSLVKFKKLVGGGSMQIVNQTIPRGAAQARLRAGDRSRRSSSTSPSTVTSSTRRASSPSTTRCSTARWARGPSGRWGTCG